MTISRKKKVVFSIIAMAISVVMMTALLLAADLVVHKRAERSAGLNRYGYRGPVVGRKRAGELRVAMLGGSTVFGYGVIWNESIPAYLEDKLAKQLQRPVTVINLGFNNEGAHALLPNLQDFAYLDYDVIVLYEGYNDLPGDEGPNRAVYRRDSAIFRTFGYYPILPLYLQEKAMALRSSNDLNAAYDDVRNRNTGRPAQVVFQPGLARRTSAAALEAVSAMTRALDSQLQNVSATPPATAATPPSEVGCTFPYIAYCNDMAAAIRYGLSRGDGVVVSSQPRLLGGRSLELHAKEQEALAAAVARTFGSEPRVSFADFSRTIDLNDTALTFDGMHLTPNGNATIAAALVDHVLKVAAAAKR